MRPCHRVTFFCALAAYTVTFQAYKGRAGSALACSFFLLLIDNKEPSSQRRVANRKVMLLFAILGLVSSIFVPLPDYEHGPNQISHRTKVQAL